MAGNDKLKLKSVCFKCNVNKWIVDYKEGCSSKISRTSVCLSCEQAEKIEKLQKSLMEKDVEIHRMKDHLNKSLMDKDVEIHRMRDQLNKLQAEVKEMKKSRENSTTGSEEGEGCSKDFSKERLEGKGACDSHGCKKSLQLEEKVERLSKIVKGTIDDIVESGRDMVEVRDQIRSVKERDDFQVVKGKRAAKGRREPEQKAVSVSNRFSLLSEEDETYLIGDSIVREQTEYFANKNKKKRRVKSFPGGKARKIVEEVRKVDLKSKTSCMVAHAGSNDIFLPNNKVGNTEPLVQELKCLVDTMSLKTNRGVIVGVLPRMYASYFASSKAIGVNERIKRYCQEKQVSFLDLWGIFVGKRQFFRKDGVHLSVAGHRKLGEILSQECERLMKKKIPPDEQPSPLDTSGSEVLNHSFLGFPKEN